MNCQKMNAWDAFGKEVRLNLKGDEKIRTGCGSCMSVFCLIVLIYYATLKMISFNQLPFDKFISLSHKDFFLRSDQVLID